MKVAKDEWLLMNKGTLIRLWVDFSAEILHDKIIEMLYSKWWKKGSVIENTISNKTIIWKWKKDFAR